MTNKPDYFFTQMKYRKPLPFEEQLRKFQSAGVEITFANANLSLEDIVRICMVREKGAYMCDFVADEDNHIVRIDINTVTEQDGSQVWDGVRADLGSDSL